MDDKMIKALDDLREELKKNSLSDAQGLITEYEQKHAEVIKAEAKAVFDSEIMVIREEYDHKMKELQEHADKLDVRLQEQKTSETDKGDPLRKLIKDNFDRISMVRKGHAIQVDTKVVGNMTLTGHLTGDQPRDYNFNVVTIPGQLLNVADLTGLVNISGGTYTFPRETGGEGAIAAQTENTDKAQVDYDLSMIDVNTDFIAGFAVYSKKMANNLPFLESWLPQALRRDYAIAENSAFNTTLSGAATASGVTSGNNIERLIEEISTLEGLNYGTNGMVTRPADYWDILVTEKSTGAGYGLPGVVTLEGGQLRINGIPIYRANWLAANKYYVGDWSRINKVVTQGLSLDFSESDEDNFRKNNITARIECQCALAVEQPAAIIYGDFTATS